jgi:hypothetical protein
LGRARPIGVLHHSYDYPSAIHTATQLQFLAPAHAVLLTTTARFVDAFEKKVHHYSVIDCTTYNKAGDAIIVQRHTNIFQIATERGGGESGAAAGGAASV